MEEEDANVDQREENPNVVTTPSGVRVILPSVRNDAHKSPSKANSAKSKKQVGISKSPSGKGSKSPMKKNSPMSHGKAKSPKRKDRTRVLDNSRKQRTHDRDDNSEFQSPMTTRSHTSNKKELNVKRKAEGTPIEGNDIYLTDPAPRAKCVKVAWRKQFPGKRVRISVVMKRIEDSEDLLYADITECKKLNVERKRPAISVWNMENLRRREYLELSDGGFGTWKLIADDGIQKEKLLDVFAKRSEIPKISAKSKLKDYKDQIRANLNEILAQKQIVEFTIEKAISDFPSDLDLRTLDMEFRNLFNQPDGYTSVHKDQNNDQQFHTPKKTTAHHNDQEDHASKDKDQSLITTEGLQLVPGIPLETSQYRNSPRTHIELDDTFNNYGKKKEFNAYEIPKMDLGFSPDKHLDSPTPISSIPPMTGFFVTLNSKTKAICDAHMANKRESKLGDSLRSPYVKRTVAIDALETSSEKKICAWINAAIEPICEPVFETSTGVVALRGTIESLCARTEIYSNIIDSWAALLNHEERFRIMVDEDTSEDVKLKLFTDNLLAAVGGDDDMLSFKSIDLHNLMIQHLYNVGHSSYDSFAGLEPVRIAVKWCTQSNSHDCGVFLMRHMECYMGELPYRWKSGLDVEGPNQVKQLQMLRNKYTAKLLLS
ncbi:hypothetical protein L6452_07500 [Arctium lappa]|uniref:Uncharacterized protein n=1 Tax=Arctium lappa TaxID=4217 RepID=A0ACB9EKX7_ARCLA|nr:hypothetical protein L6452_07500 [Arctium lappa]